MYEEGLALIDLNQEKARGKFAEADGEIKRALELKPKDEKALELSTKISNKLKETENLAKVEFSKVFETDGNLVSLSKDEGNLVGVTNSSIYIVDVDSETADEIKGQSGTSDAAFYDNKIFASDGETVYQIGLVSGEISEIFDGEQSQDIAVFFGNVYLLGSDQIYKYTPVENGYAQSANYLNTSKQFDNSSKFVIDGSVWVSSGSEVNEYLRGDKESFQISGLTSKTGKLGEIYTESEIENVYVVDGENSALLVFGKDGVYKKAYQSSEFRSVKGLVVDEEAGKFYIAVGSEILASEL